MFYCDSCGMEKTWPDSLVKSQGRCEICGKTATCNDTPSANLPKDPRSAALSELATVCGAYAFAVIPSVEMRVRFACAKKMCRDAGMSDEEIAAQIIEFGEIAREAIRKTFP